MTILAFSEFQTDKAAGERASAAGPITDELLAQLELFLGLQRRPPLYRYKGSVALLRKRAGDEVVRRGENSKRGYYVLTASDEFALLRWQLHHSRPRRADAEIAEQLRLARTQVQEGRPPLPTLGIMVYAAAQPHLAGSLPEEQDFLTPNRGTHRDHLQIHNGELVGEANCLQGLPQPATIVALRDCYLLEMRADILRAVIEDPAYVARTEEAYRHHVLRKQLEQLPLFRDLTDEEFEEIQEAVELSTYEPGQVITDEHEPCAGLYLVRGGMVKLVKNVSALVGPADVHDWDTLVSRLREGLSRRQTAVHAIWRRFSVNARLACEEAIEGDLTSPRIQAAILAALNEFIVNDNELPDVLQPDREQTLQFRPRLDARRKHRQVLDEVFAPVLRDHDSVRPTEYILNYCSRGDTFGASDLLLGKSCSATALAFGHPNAAGKVDLAFLPAEAFWDLMNSSARLRERIKRETKRQLKQAEERIAEPKWDHRAQRHLSTEAAALGLAQGQRLMLIDLERCTRCDDCVRACADIHTDGLPRLNLDGPRFEKYLVPTTCRACLDPVCLIGCPVNSIHRGSNLEIEVNDWCVGCGLCAESCPYGAIHMTDVGILAEPSAEWLFTPQEQVSCQDWMLPHIQPRGWLSASLPFHLDRCTREELGAHFLPTEPKRLYFRRKFAVSETQLFSDSKFRLEIHSPANEILVWLNGIPLAANERSRLHRQHFWFSGFDVKLAKSGNLLAIKIGDYDADSNQEPLLRARIDQLDSGAAEEAVFHPERAITSKATVCDLCAGTGRQPVCVTVCAHEAAFRVEASKKLP